MPWWADILDVVGLLAVVSLALLGSLFIRRRVLSRKGGTFECSLRTRQPRKGPSGGALGWQLGLGRYNGERLEWFRVFSFLPRPKAVFDRSVEVLSRRRPHGAEAFSLYSGHIVIAVRLSSGQIIELAMSERALTAFLAWTEAAPPGQERLLG
jgi:hypothetical protein